ncbi:hypothetical protein KK088_21630 [Enterobacter asburiae]|uniref:hypothetical protein n=1 Tax=Enterobacter asburiae TaxID=61645 RepID=UPI001BDDD43E|nr:hypothetical protein [Enterobacter asburiae]MBT1734868.1 hypothetical protein [Enterobacter asburiae]
MLQYNNLYLVNENAFLINGVSSIFEKLDLFKNIYCMPKLAIHDLNKDTDRICCVFFNESDFIRDLSNEETIDKISHAKCKILVFCKKRNIHLIRHIAHGFTKKTAFDIVCVAIETEKCLFKSIHKWLLLSNKKRHSVIKCLRFSSAQLSVLQLSLKGYSLYEISIILGKNSKFLSNSLGAALLKLNVNNFNSFYVDFWDVRDLLLKCLNYHHTPKIIKGSTFQNHI